jgi:hypothetical protein
VNWRYGSDLWGTEFEGGAVTGRLLDLKLVGDLLLLLAMPLTFVFRRIAAATILLACLLCLPLYLYFTAPGPFRWVVGGEWSVPLLASFAWDWWSIGGIATLIFAAFVCLRSLAIPSARCSSVDERDSVAPRRAGS